MLSLERSFGRLLCVPGLNVNHLVRPPPRALPDCLFSLFTLLLTQSEGDTAKVDNMMDTTRSSNSLDMFEATESGVEAFQINVQGFISD